MIRLAFGPRAEHTRPSHQKHQKFCHVDSIADLAVPQKVFAPAVNTKTLTY